jgi:hypothetical protein
MFTISSRARARYRYRYRFRFSRVFAEIDLIIEVCIATNTGEKCGPRESAEDGQI